MIKNTNLDKGIAYILIAVLCLTNLFLGVKVIGKFSTIKKLKTMHEEDILEDKVISVFNNKAMSLDVELKDNVNNGISKQNGDRAINKGDNDFFLRLLLNSNVYMKRVYDMQNREDSILLTKGNIFERLSALFKPDFYIKPHLPAMVSAFNNTYTWEEIKEEGEHDELEGYIILSDIIFIEDPEEKNDFEQELELIGKKHEEKVYVEPPKTVALDHEKPYILLYHTHGTEAYLPITTGRFHTEKREYNVITIGEIIGRSLEEKGHKLKHIDIYHDIPSYNQSYIRSLATIKEELNKNESIKVIFDIHRDGIEGESASTTKAQESARISINDKSVATFSLVIGPDNPNKEQLIKFANYIRHISEGMYPGLCKGIIMKPSGKFNQYVSDYYALIEVGSNLNTIEEAKESAKYIGEILHKVIESIDEGE